MLLCGYYNMDMRGSDVYNDQPPTAIDAHFSNGAKDDPAALVVERGWRTFHLFALEILERRIVRDPIRPAKPMPAVN